ncbi:MAG TPA: hypothetical protein VHM69_19595 [Rubrobacter sp.]|nr:hypothetical protein [Rubrobacter sp.]
MNAGPEESSSRAHEESEARIIDVADLAHSETAYEFEGHHHGDTNVSFIVVSDTNATRGACPCSAHLGHSG